MGIRILFFSHILTMRSFSVVLLITIIALSHCVAAKRSNKGRGHHYRTAKNAHKVLLAQVNESIGNLKVLAQMLNNANKNAAQSEFGFGDIVNFGKKAIATGQNVYNRAMEVKEKVMPIVQKVVPIAQNVIQTGAQMFAAQKAKQGAKVRKVAKMLSQSQSQSQGAPPPAKGAAAPPAASPDAVVPQAANDGKKMTPQQIKDWLKKNPDLQKHVDQVAPNMLAVQKDVVKAQDSLKMMGIPISNAMDILMIAGPKDSIQSVGASLGYKFKNPKWTYAVEGLKKALSKSKADTIALHTDFENRKTPTAVREYVLKKAGIDAQAMGLTKKL